MVSTQNLERQKRARMTVRFAGDSGDGMQIAGDRLANISAIFGNDVATLADFPAEIRAPAGTTFGVSGYQLQIGGGEVMTPGDGLDLLVAMNPAALKVNVQRVSPGGLIIVNSDAFTEKNILRAGYDSDPLEGDGLAGFRVVKMAMTKLTLEALKGDPLNNKEKNRCKNFFALGLVGWLLDRPIEHATQWIGQKFEKRPEIADANIKVLKEGVTAGSVQEVFNGGFSIPSTDMKLDPGTYRFMNGNVALAMGLVSAAKVAGKKLFFGSYPITPASDVLHELNKLRHFGVTTFQAEDEIAAIGSSLGASYAGALGVTSTSGPGLALKGEFMGLAVMTELPLVVLDIQRAGPSTGMPTKTEQSDLLMALYGRNGESPLVVLAAESPADCFSIAYEACRIAMTFMIPVVVLSDGYLANGNEAWAIPDAGSLPPIDLPKSEKDGFQPYKRDPKTLARPWAIPGTKGFEHRIGGLEKEDITGDVCYDPENHAKMVGLREEKLKRVQGQLEAPRAAGDESGDILLIGWGSSFGPLRQALSELRNDGIKVGHLSLRYINPFSPGLRDIFERYRRLVVMENNRGQLLMKLRHEFSESTFEFFGQCKGQPFVVEEVVSATKSLLEEH